MVVGDLILGLFFILGAVCLWILMGIQAVLAYVAILAVTVAIVGAIMWLTIHYNDKVNFKIKK